MTDQTLSSQNSAHCALSRMAVRAPEHEARRAPFRLLWRLALRLNRILRYRRDRAHLAEFPDYLLEDIGLTRVDIPRLRQVRLDWR